MDPIHPVQSWSQSFTAIIRVVDYMKSVSVFNAYGSSCNLKEVSKNRMREIRLDDCPAKLTTAFILYDRY
jgi:hypothetical protein